MLVATRERELERLHEGLAVVAGDERKRRLKVAGKNRLVRVDRHVRAESQEVVIPFAQEGKLAAGTRWIQAHVAGAFVSIGFVAHLRAGRDANSAAVENTPQLTVHLRVPHKKSRPAKPVLIPVHAIDHRRRVLEELIDDDLPVDNFEGDGKRVERRRIRAGERPAQERLAHLEMLVFVRLRTGTDHRRLPLPAVAKFPAQTAEHPPRIRADLSHARLETIARILPGRNARPQ